MKAPKESSLYRPIIDLLALHGIRAWRNNVGAMRVGTATERPRYVRFGFPGLSDISGVLPVSPTHQAGRALFIEVKHGRGRLTIEQTAFLADMERQGALCFVVKSLAEVEAGLQRAGYCEGLHR